MGGSGSSIAAFLASFGPGGMAAGVLWIGLIGIGTFIAADFSTGLLIYYYLYSVVKKKGKAEAIDFLIRHKIFFGNDIYAYTEYVRSL